MGLLVPRCTGGGIFPRRGLRTSHPAVAGRPTPPGYRVGGLVGQFQQHRQQPRPRAAPTRHLHRRSAPAVTSKDTPGVVQGDAGRSRQARGRQCAHWRSASRSAWCTG